METRANYVLVGLFTVLVIVVGFAFVWWSANVSNEDKQVQLLVRIEGSVTGLSVGSQVLFNGLKVGDVRNLRIDPNNPRVVIATTTVDATTPITPSTRATIGFAGLTGQAFIELKGGDVRERNILTYAREQGAVAVIKADPSDVTDILATAKDIAQRADNILSQFEGMVKDVGPAVRTTADNITATSENVKVFTDSLAKNSGQIDNFLKSVSNLADTANTVAEALPDAIKSAQNVIEAVDPASVKAAVDNVAAVTQTLRDQSGNIAGIVESVKTAAASVGRVGDIVDRNAPQIDRFITNLGPISDTAKSVATRLDTTLASASDILAGVDPAKVSGAITDISGAAKSVSDVATMIGGQTEAIRETLDNAAGISRDIKGVTASVAENREALERFMAGLGPISDTAQRVATRLDSAVTSADRLLSSVDPTTVTGVVTDISSAARSVSEVSAMIGTEAPAIKETLGNVADISRSIKGVTDSVAANKEAIDRFVASLGPISDNARQASTTLNRTMEDAQQLISGIDRKRITETVDNVAALVAGVRAKTPEIQSIIDGVNQTIGTVETTVGGFNGTRQRVDNILAGIDPETVNRAMTNVSSATGNVARAADSIASIADGIGARRADIDSIITNAQQTSAKVNTASTRLDTVLASLDRLLKADSTEGLAKEASQTLASIRKTAENINSRIGPIADNIQSFSGNGLSEVRALVRDVTRSVNRIEGAVTDFQNNPSRIIFGGQEVKQFDGRSRR